MGTVFTFHFEEDLWNRVTVPLSVDLPLARHLAFNATMLYRVPFEEAHSDALVGLVKAEQGSTGE